MLKMTFFWLLFRGKFEQKTQKSISFKNQWRLKNIKKAMVVKNIIAEDMPFTKSIFEQFWRSYCKKTIFVVFHFLKFLPKSKNEDFFSFSGTPQFDDTGFCKSDQSLWRLLLILNERGICPMSFQLHRKWGNLGKISFVAGTR